MTSDPSPAPGDDPGLAALVADLATAVDTLTPELVALRRDLHANPELSWQEKRTTDTVASHLDAAGIAYRRLPASGLVADLGAEQASYRVAIRADLDALPVRERTGLPWSSVTPGVCHACGHDVHTVAVLGAGLALHRHEEELRERGIGVRLIFQPAEETIPGGAHEVLANNGMADVDVVYAVHCDPSVDVGRVALREGAITAACDSVTVELRGHGGHTSRPHLTEDLTFALAKVVTEVPAALSRRLDPRAGAALVWGVIEAGKAPNVIPSSGVCKGTLRMLDAEAWQAVGPLLDELVQQVVAPYAVTARVDRVKGVPPVVNQSDAVAALRAAAEGVGLGVVPTTQSLGGEDFAWYLAVTPGAMARLGTRTPGGHTFDLHQGDLVVDEDAIGHGARFLAAAVVAQRVKP